MPTKREPSAVTLRCRAMVKIERCKEKMVRLESMDEGRRRRHDEKMAALDAEVESANAELAPDPNPVP